MARQDGVNIEKLQGGLNRASVNTDSHFALIATGLPAGDIATAINNGGKGVVVKSLFEAEQIGINTAFDANNSLRLHADVSEFFRLAPEATLYIFSVATEVALKAFLNQNKDIKGYGVCITYIPTAGEVTENLTPEIILHQKIINDFAAQNRLIDFAIIGANEMTVFTEDLRALSAPNVSVTVACSDNSEVVNMGAVLGMLGVRQVNENIGSVNVMSKPLAKRGTADYPLTDQVQGLWLDAYLTDGRSVEAISKTELTSLSEKGYIVAAGYEGYPGYFFNNSSTCIDVASDFAYIENNRVWNKAARIIRTTLIPEVKGTVKKDPTTGFIASTTASRWQQLVSKALNQMVINNEISGFDVLIDHRQVVNSTEPVKVKALVVADGIVHEFEVALGLTNNI